ncbi:hypothetical protein UF75_5133 [Desulfosporosinus sp. I2]|uniref:DUF6262 family protein n=1 Tax=Desulfosporosinus sp. I2 TaxID=1617025 RepID=UPI0005F0AD5A|nr:DUF6262 family protein [Desulfosporosinus sp. I2]KJR44484.1 hypothetical protein UF75_5133 [Desulfosporosinus sp. I2]
MRKVPEQLMAKQETQRQKTINLVLRAIRDLKDEGYSIKIKDLMEATGLSRSVFAKPHIRKLLADKGIGYAKTEPSVPAPPVFRKQSQITNLKEKLAQKDEYIAKLTDENQALKNECELLRGKLFLLMQRQSMKNQ